MQLAVSSTLLPEEDAMPIREILRDAFDITGDFTAERLGGLTNRNYHVIAGDLNAVFRLPGAGTEGLVDRKIEGDITRAASSIGVDNELLYYDDKTGNKVVAYVEDAETMHIDSMREPENTVLAGKVLRKLHDNGSPVDFRFNVFEMIPSYEKLIRRHEDITWPGYAEFREKLFQYRNRMENSEIALCHCDPLCENFVKSLKENRMYLVDWEYGGMNDPMWDVADVIIESGYNTEQRNLFTRSYFGRPATPDEDERISINIVLIDFLWALWGQQRCWYDKSLEGYGIKRFTRAQKNYQELLIDMQNATATSRAASALA